MVCKILGGYSFQSKKNNREWVNICVEPADVPTNLIGQWCETFMCSADRLPEPISKMVGHSYAISTNNNFVSEFFKIPGKDNA